MSKRKQIEELIEHFQNQEGTEYVAKHLTAALSYLPSEDNEITDESTTNTATTEDLTDVDVKYEWVDPEMDDKEED